MVYIAIRYSYCLYCIYRLRFPSTLIFLVLFLGKTTLGHESRDHHVTINNIELNQNTPTNLAPKKLNRAY